MSATIRLAFTQGRHLLNLWDAAAILCVFVVLIGVVEVARGTITAIAAEVASWGDTKLTAYGLGAYIAAATDKSDMAREVLGVAVMSGFVLLFNRLLWRPLYAYSERHLRLG
jgi:ABC-type anion transport system duplicated permease subunit